MFIVNCKVLSKHVCFIFISDYICKYANNKIWEKEKSGRAICMQNEIIEYDIALLPPRILATGFCVHMRLEFYLMPITLMVHVVFIDIGPVVDTLPISMQAMIYLLNVQL